MTEPTFPFKEVKITVLIWDKISPAKISRDIEIKLKDKQTLKQAVEEIMYFLDPTLDGLCNETFLISGLSKKF